MASMHVTNPYWRSIKIDVSKSSLICRFSVSLRRAGDHKYVIFQAARHTLKNNIIRPYAIFRHKLEVLVPIQLRCSEVNDATWNL